LPGKEVQAKINKKTAGAAHPAKAVLTPSTTGGVIKNKFKTKKIC
jgi:hypothetical protein